MTDFYLVEGEDLVAIADAVRTKTGSTDKMTLSGIISGIEGIEIGGNGSSGGKIVTGTITPSSQDLYNNPITISGLGFKPRMVVVRNTESRGFQSLGSGYFLVTIIEIADGENAVSQTNYATVSSSITMCDVTALSGKFYYICTINDDGFTITAEYANRKLMPENYSYIAVE